MPYIDAALAFALSMLAIAIFVNNLIIFVIKPRKKRVMAQAVRHFAENELLNVFQRECEKLKKSAPGITSSALLASLTELQQNLLKNSSGQSPAVPRGDGTNEIQIKNIRGEDIVSVPANELVNLIKRSAFGKLLVAEIGDQAELVFDSFFNKYEGVRAISRETTRRYATQVSMFAGVLVALALNINTFTLVTVYIGDPQARSAIISQSESLVLEAQKAIIADCRAKPAAEFDACLENSLVTKETLERQKAQLAELIPMGWNGKTLQEIAASFKSTICDQFLYYFLGCFLTGILAGLGTPFWFDTVRSITNFTRAVSGKSPEPATVDRPVTTTQ